MNDDEPTHPGIKPPQCSFCRQPYTSHAEGCEAEKYAERLRRDIAARIHFNAMTRDERIEAIAQGARQRGAQLYFRGNAR